MNDLMTKSFASYVDFFKSTTQNIDLEAGEIQMQSSEDQNHLTSFLQEAELVKQEINSIRDTLTHLESANQQSKTLHNPEALKSIRRDINGEIVNVLKKARTIKSRLEGMEMAEGTPNYHRTRTAVVNGLKKKLKELMGDFQVFRDKMTAEYKETVGRRYYTVTGEEATEEVIEKIVSRGSDGAEEFLSRAIQEHGRGRVLETVAEIQDRRDAAKEMETSLLELHQVFLDMSVIVEAQGEKMDNIEDHLMNADHYITAGTKDLKAAKWYQRSSRKCMCFGICFGIILLLMIIIVLFVIQIVTILSSGSKGVQEVSPAHEGS